MLTSIFGERKSTNLKWGDFKPIGMGKLLEQLLSTNNERGLIKTILIGIMSPEV